MNKTKFSCSERGIDNAKIIDLPETGVKLYLEYYNNIRIGKWILCNNFIFSRYNIQLQQEYCLVLHQDSAWCHIRMFICIAAGHCHV